MRSLVTQRHYIILQFSLLKPNVNSKKIYKRLFKKSRSSGRILDFEQPIFHFYSFMHYMKNARKNECQFSANFNHMLTLQCARYQKHKFVACVFHCRESGCSQYGTLHRFKSLKSTFLKTKGSINSILHTSMDIR